MTVTITVPAVPAGHHPAACWRRTLTRLKSGESGGRAVCGEWLHAGDTVAVPAGTLVLAVDKTTTGWDTHYRTGERYPVKDATVTVYLAGPDGLTELWTRHFKHAKSAFGAGSLKKLARLLEQYPALGGSVTVVEEVRRPNLKPGTCRWCGTVVPARCGHTVGHGEDAQVEDWRSCPPRRAVSGTPCALCGVTVCADDAELVLVREGEGRWETRHRSVMRCTEYPPLSWEEMQQQRQAEREAERKRQEKREKDRQRRQARKREKQAAERAAHDAEQERIKDLATVSRASRELYDKGLGSGRRARLLEHTDTLEDGTTTTRWSVETYVAGSGWNGEDYDPDPGQAEHYTRLPDARGAYQALKFEPAPLRRRAGGPPCDNCERSGARHTRYDSSGIKGTVCDHCNQDEDFMLSFA
ncbi:hypothetical protein ABZ569_33355 [Streptomyces albus]|uniref:hypothetical protein n=1 Tax=Streptomyces albus TaxID=1888 RepID=UPI0033D2AB2E